METNRDDFIIAIRSAFLKKGTKQRFSLIVLLFFSITILTLSKYNFKGISFLKSGLNEIVYRASFIISSLVLLGFSFRTIRPKGTSPFKLSLKPTTAHSAISS